MPFPSAPSRSRRFTDPVTLSCGHTFEHWNIREWRLVTDHGRSQLACCPSCRTQVYPWPTANLALREAIDAYYEEHPESRPTPVPPRMPPLPIPITPAINNDILAYMVPDVDLEREIAALSLPDALSRVAAAVQDKPYNLEWLILRARLEERCGLRAAASAAGSTS